MTTLLEKATKVYTPSTPVDARFMVGRAQQERDLKRVLRSPGQHAIVTGHRGVGKTSLVSAVIRRGDRPAPKPFTCGPKGVTFDGIFRYLLVKLGADLAEIEKTVQSTSSGKINASILGFGANVEGEHTTSSRSTSLGGLTLTPPVVAVLLIERWPNAVLVIDEYDAIGKGSAANDVHQNLAYLLKILSDSGSPCDVTLIVVGIASSASELLGKHASIERCTRDIYLNPLRLQDVLDFLRETEDFLGFQFEDRVRSAIARGASGFPYYAHLVALASLEKMFERDVSGKRVEWKDFLSGVDQAVEDAFRSELRKYMEVLPKLSKVERTIVAAMAEYRQFAPKRTSFKNYVTRAANVDGAAFDEAMWQLVQTHQLLHLIRTTDQLRFADPLLKPFLRAKVFRRRTRVDPKRVPRVQTELLLDTGEMSVEEESPYRK